MRIKQLGHPILRTISKTVPKQDISSTEVQATLTLMKDTLNGIKAISDENGNALSAPQVGHNIRAIMLRLHGEFVPMINPHFTDCSDATFAFEEECFSLYNVRGQVIRHKQVDVSYMDEFGQSHTRTLVGDEAGLVQHELDHLDGIFFLDKIHDHQALTTVDVILKDDPSRLKVVREMMDYMAS